MSNPTTGDCLTPGLLEQLAHDGLSPLEIAEVEDHVDNCDRCRTTLEAVFSDAQWTSDIQPVLRTPVESVPDLDLDDCEELGVDTPRYDSILPLLGPTDDPNMLGRIGSYEIVGVIGSGGMGVVFKAFEPTLNRFVAIKMLLPHLAESGAARKRFAREGQAAAAVVNDHVLPIYSVAEWRGVPYIVTQFLRGSTLQKRIQQQGPLELKEIIRIGLQTARGLAAAHAQGLVHRDVKPSNILLDGTVERAMLTDFGLARAVDDASITRTGIISGTPQFMSPEQANGDAIDHRSDLFSLGSVLYAMCTGRPPFRADSTFGVLRKIRETSPRPIREINGDIPAWLEGLVTKLLSKDQSERFASADEVAGLLEQCLAHVQQPATVPLPPEVTRLMKQDVHMELKQPVASSPTTQRTRRRRAWIATLIVVPFVAAGLVFALKQGMHRQEADNSAVPAAETSARSPSNGLLEWNAIQSAFAEVDSDLDPFEAGIESGIEQVAEKMEIETAPINTDSGDNP
jgi:serine/threonine-protein kinase